MPPCRRARRRPLSPTPFPCARYPVAQWQSEGRKGQGLGSTGCRFARPVPPRLRHLTRDVASLIPWRPATTSSTGCRCALPVPPRLRHLTRDVAELVPWHPGSFPHRRSHGGHRVHRGGQPLPVVCCSSPLPRPRDVDTFIARRPAPSPLLPHAAQTKPPPRGRGLMEGWRSKRLDAFLHPADKCSADAECQGEQAGRFRNSFGDDSNLVNCADRASTEIDGVAVPGDAFDLARREF